MKYCSKCGKELMDEAVICTGCGCPVQPQSQPKPQRKEVPLDDMVKGAATTNIIAAIILALGVCCALLVNGWVGAALCLAAEVVALVPNSKLQKALKRNYSALDKKAFKEAGKKDIKELKAKYSGFKFSFILAYVALACLIVFVLFWY